MDFALHAAVRQSVRWYKAWSFAAACVSGEDDNAPERENLMNGSLPPVRLGIDLGGTKIEVVALDPDGRELLRRRVPTPREDYRAILAAVVGLVRDAEQAVGRGTVASAHPAPPPELRVSCAAPTPCA